MEFLVFKLIISTITSIFVKSCFKGLFQCNVRLHKPYNLCKKIEHMRLET